MLLRILPQEAGITDLKIIRQLREGLSFSEDELAEFELKHDEERQAVTWNLEKGRLKDVKFGRRAHEIIIQVFQRRADLTEDYIGLYDRLSDEKDG